MLLPKEEKGVIAIDLDVAMVNQHAPCVWCILWLLLLHRSLVPSNEALGMRVTIVEVRGNFEPVVQYASAGVSLCSLFTVCWSLYMCIVCCLLGFMLGTNVMQIIPEVAGCNYFT